MLQSKTLNIRTENGVCYITFPALEQCGVKHAFTTRIGGVSKGVYSSMNMSFFRGDDAADVTENYRRICEIIGTDYRRCVLSKQTHTTNIRIVTESDAGKGIICERDFDDTDGLITDVPGITLVTQFADCTGLLFCDPKKRVIAASHAGWRGTAGEIGRLTVEKMHDSFGCDPGDIRAGIAPSIGPCCFEVDQPVIDQFEKIKSYDVSKVIKDDGNGKYHVDLWKANCLSLLSAGLREENISVTDICTKCNSDVFFSHRVTGFDRGNLAALICL